MMESSAKIGVSGLKIAVVRAPTTKNDSGVLGDCLNNPKTVGTTEVIDTMKYEGYTFRSGKESSEIIDI